MTKWLNTLLVILIFTLPFGQLTRVNLTPEIAIYLSDVVTLVLALYLLVVGISKKLLITKEEIKPFFPFVIAAIASLLVNVTVHPLAETTVAVLYLFRWLAVGGIFLATRQAINTLFLKRCLVLAIVLFALLGLGQYVLIPDTRFLYYLGWDDHYYRLIGTFFDPAFTGITLVIGILLLCDRQFNTIKRSYRLIGLLVTFIALVLTYSRSSYLALGVGLLVLNLKLLPVKKYIIFLLLGFGILLAVSGKTGEGVNLLRTKSISARFDNTVSGITIFIQKPILGHGFNYLRYVARDNLSPIDSRPPSHAASGLDNSLLFVLATTGIIGFGAYLYLWFSIIKKCNRLFLAVFAAVTIHAFLNNTLFYLPVMLILWLVAGITSKDVKS